MQSQRLAIPDLVMLEPKAFVDDRGSMFESFNARDFSEATGHDASFAQDNHSVSKRGVLRGLHYQAAPHAQGKLVRVIAGSVFDVAVDLRRSSPSFGQWAGVELSAANRRQLWIPEGFAHGFLALEEGTEFVYKITGFWHQPSERSIRWDDPEVGIAWPLTGAPLLSAKDEAAPLLRDAEVFE